MRVWLAFLLVLAFCTALFADEGHKHAGAPPEQLGKVVFPTSCKAGANDQFLRGLALLHSFWYPEAEKAFRAAAAADKNCAIAWWGVASAIYHPLWEHPSTGILKQGNEALANAGKAGARTERERDYIAAISAFYEGEREYRDRAVAWSAAMERLAAKYPRDDEAAIFYALSLLASEKPGDKTHPNHRKAGAVLQPIFQRRPAHPGVAHYLIHSYDSPDLAELGVPAAQRYAQVAPSVPHALHMPSHIFERLGLWQSSIMSNVRSSDAAREHRKTLGPNSGVGDEVHALDFLSYAYLQIVQDSKALAAVERAEKLTMETAQSRDYAAQVRATYEFERRNWKAAAALPEPPANSGRDDDLPAWWVRTIGAARIHDLERARQSLAVLKEAADRGEDTVARRGGLGRKQLYLSAAAWVAQAEGKPEALQLMRSALEAETSSGSVGRVAASALLGDLLLELNRPMEALAAYEESLRLVPRRFNVVYGAARAAELAGQRERARVFYSQLAELGRDADTDRPELRQARTFIAQR